MKTEEKIALCSGKDFWTTKSFPVDGITSFMMSDGPSGIRKQLDRDDHLGLNKSYAATAFPTSSLSACSFDEELLREIGKTIGEEAISENIKIVLGPGCNIKRSPLCGRNFEYFSEDPFLSGKMAASYIKGVQATGINACVKHFALNNQEYKRFSSNSIIDEKSMREIYLKPFEIAVKEGKPKCLMSSYNKVNGIHASENKWLLTDVLRKEWGFDGLAITDWGGMSNRTNSFEAGLDLCMPGGSCFGESQALKDISENRLDESFVDQSVERIIKIADKEIKTLKANYDNNYEIAKKVAEDSIVLLKNEEQILPIKKEEVAFIGTMAKKMRYQGSGSSHTCPYKLINPLDVIDVPFVPGYNEDGSTNEELLKEAKELASKMKKVVLFIGLTDKYESEGFDRDNLKLPTGHLKLIEEISKVNQNIIVVLMSGSVVELPFLNDIKGLLYAGLSGEAGGEAIVNILLGKVNPSGKMAETWAKRLEDYVTCAYYGSKDALYKEGIYVGYRYFDKANIEVNFPFGYGLSYSNFVYDNLEYQDNILSCTVENDSDVFGKEIVELYIHNPEGYRAKRELKGFQKIALKPHEKKKVSFVIDKEMFKVFHDEWKIIKGKYQLEIASSSRDIKLTKEIEITGEEDCYPNLSEWYYSLKGKVSDEDFKTLYKGEIVSDVLKKGHFTMENTIMEMKDYSLIMKIVYKVMEKVIAKSNGGKVDYDNPSFRMMMASSADCSLNATKICGAMNNMVLEGMLEMANGHFFKGLFTMMKKN